MDGGHNTQNHPEEKKMVRGKVVVWGGLTKSWEKEKQKAKEERKDITMWMQSSKD